MVKLEQRDKKALIFGGAAAAMILLYVFVASPVLSDLSRKQELIPKKEHDLTEMKKLRTQYVEIEQRLKEAQAEAAKRGPLLTDIENITKRANLSSKIASLKPQAGVQTDTFKESVVEVRLENITLYDIVNYVYQIEKNTLRIRKLQFKPRFDNPKLLNATILVASAG